MYSNLLVLLSNTTAITFSSCKVNQKYRSGRPLWSWYYTPMETRCSAWFPWLVTDREQIQNRQTWSLLELGCGTSTAWKERRGKGEIYFAPRLFNTISFHLYTKVTVSRLEEVWYKDTGKVINLEWKLKGAFNTEVEWVKHYFEIFRLTLSCLHSMSGKNKSTKAGWIWSFYLYLIELDVL